MQKQTIITIFALIILIGLIVAGYFAPKERINQPEESAVLSPREVVEKFIEADMAGARIGGDIAKQAPEIYQYVLWEFGPGWDTAMTINKFEIIDENESNGVALVEVIYLCENGGFSFSTGDIQGEQENIKLGIKDCLTFFSEQDNKTDLMTSYNYKNKTEGVLYVLKQEKEKWKIIYPILPPHISINTFQTRFNEITNEIK